MPIRLLVPTDGSEQSAQGAQIAARICAVIGARATVANVLDLRRIEHKMIPDFQVEMIKERARDTAKRLLSLEAARMAQVGVEAETMLLEGPPAEALCEEAAKHHDFIVMGATIHGDLHDIFFGSVGSALIHTCTTPILVVKDGGSDWSHLRRGDKAKVLVGVDGSAPSTRCVDFLEEIDSKEGIVLTLISVVKERQDRERAGQVLEERAAQLRTAGYEVSTMLKEGDAGVTICSTYSEGGFDLLAVGKHDLSELEERLVGSVCHFLFHNCLGHQLIVP